MILYLFIFVLAVFLGFELINISPSDMAIFQRMFEKYGSQNTTKAKGTDDYMWR